MARSARIDDLPASYQQPAGLRDGRAPRTSCGGTQPVSGERPSAGAACALALPDRRCYRRGRVRGGRGFGLFIPRRAAGGAPARPPSFSPPPPAVFFSAARACRLSGGIGPSGAARATSAAAVVPGASHPGRVIYILLRPTPRWVGGLTTRSETSARPREVEDPALGPWIRACAGMSGALLRVGSVSLKRRQYSSIRGYAALRLKCARHARLRRPPSPWVGRGRCAHGIPREPWAADRCRARADPPPPPAP